MRIAFEFYNEIFDRPDRVGAHSPQNAARNINSLRQQLTAYVAATVSISQMDPRNTALEDLLVPE